MKEKGGGGGRGRQKGWPCRCLLSPADTQALWDFTLGLQRREDWNSALPEIRTRIRVLCQEEVISLQSSAQAEALGPDSCIQDRGTRKTGRIGSVQERKERGKGREVNKVSWSLRSGHSGQLPRSGGDQGQKGPKLRPLGLAHQQATWPLSTPSGQDVSRSEGESPAELPLVAGRGTPSRAQNWALV